jgi:RNA polymerase sigma-70 factor, ECF subfamily
VVRVEETDGDAALMAAFVQTRDRKVFEQLFERYRRAIVAHAARYVKDRARAEELAQEIFVRVYTTKSYQANAKFKTWLYRVATNVCLNELRRPENKEKLESLNGVEETKNVSASVLISRPVSPEEVLSSVELAKRVDRALDALPANQRAAFLMARHDNMSHEEIAEALETSVSAVKSLIHRALEALRKEVNMVLRAEPVLEPKEAVR